jgi:hypothetical protein
MLLCTVHHTCALVTTQAPNVWVHARSSLSFAVACELADNLIIPTLLPWLLLTCKSIDNFEFHLLCNIMLDHTWQTAATARRRRVQCGIDELDVLGQFIILFGGEPLHHLIHNAQQNRSFGSQHFDAF